jgi:hypothetical protein
LINKELLKTSIFSNLVYFKEKKQASPGDSAEGTKEELAGGDRRQHKNGI